MVAHFRSGKRKPQNAANPRAEKSPSGNIPLRNNQRAARFGTIQTQAVELEYDQAVDCRFLQRPPSYFIDTRPRNPCIRNNRQEYSEMRRYRHILFLAIGIFISCLAPAHADPESDKSMAVEVSRNGNTLIIDATILLPATPHEAWEVLTDFDHMVGFLRNLEVSRVVERADHKFQVAQKGKATFGPLSFSFDTVREVELKPFQEIRSRVISGSVKQGQGTTQLIPDGNGTRIVYHNETVPNYWLPPGIGPAMVKKEVRAQFEDMKTEMERRKTEKQRNVHPG